MVLSSSGLVGRPTKRTPQAEADVIRWFVRAVVCEPVLPSDEEIGAVFEMCPRLIRQIRLDHGLNRREIATWRPAQSVETQPDTSFVAYSPYGGVWLILGVILQSVWKHTLRALKMPKGCAIHAHQFVLTLVLCALLGLRRLYHLEDLRHPSDVALALFTGRTRLLSDSTVWDIVHGLSKEAITDFHTATACTQIALAQPEVSATHISFDDHVVPCFTRLKPAPLQKTRVPCRGRSLPAIRLYFTWDIDQKCFLDLTVTEPSKRLSQMLPDLIAQIRLLKQKAGHPNPRKLRIVFDRGGYKGAVFDQLMSDPDIEFLTLACTYPNSVRQWEELPEASFIPFVLPNEEPLPPDQQTPLKAAQAQTTIKDCARPIPSIVIRDERSDRPQGVPKWRVFFTKDETLSPKDAFGRYHDRQDHEGGYRGFKGDLPGDVIPKPYHLIRAKNDQGQHRRTLGTQASQDDRNNVLLVAWIKGLTFNLIRQFGHQLGAPYDRMTPGSLLRKFLLRPGHIILSEDRLHVVLDPFTEAEALTPFLEQINQQQLTIPWLAHRRLNITIAEQAMGTTDNLPLLKRLISANPRQRKVA